MKFGVREICDVVLKAKGTQMIGNKKFYKNEPVLYFDSLKTSTMEGAATTVYAQGGRGNSRLIAWEGERTVTFTMEDALISAAGLAILTGADLIEATETATIKVHATQTVDKKDVTIDTEKADITIKLDNADDEVYSASEENYIYVMGLKDGEVVTEPYCVGVTADSNVITIPAKNEEDNDINDIGALKNCDAVLVDYYVVKKSGVMQIDITPDKFGGNYYLEASTLFRNTDGVDMPAEFIIPNCKVQSNFTFTMASSGDPSAFTFTMDAFPDYTRFDPTKKVLSAIQVIGLGNEVEEKRDKTAHSWVAGE